jgi:heme oxygenase
MTGQTLTSNQASQLRHYLRQRTAQAHGELDASVGLLDSMDRYARYLTGQFRFRAGIERPLSRTSFPAWFGDWRPQPLAGALAADLAALGMDTPDPAGGVPEGRLDGESGLVGVLYVLEGAALGARFLYRGVRDLGLTAGTGAYHLELQTGGESWQGFLGLLGRSSIDREEAAEAAVATFAYARSAFATGAFAKDLHEQS